MMKRASLRIRGDVQMAGFRTFIKTVADSLVKRNSPSFVRIEEVKAVYEDYKGEFSSFERRGVDVLGEGESEMVALMRSFDKKGEVMIGILSSMDETLKGVKGDTNKTLKKQDMMLEKQDETIDAIDRSKEEIVTEISSLSQPFSF
jgi:acylphosphatase